MENDGKVIALLIDADNVSPKYIKTIIDEVSMYGTPAYKRIYGDWTAPDMVSWKKMLLEHNLTPIQQFSYTQGKNASDSAMIIDAMDILYTKNVDGFCIVSSDSDFTRLAARLRESRMFVIGMGESKTPTAFKSACVTFHAIVQLWIVEHDSDEDGYMPLSQVGVMLSRIYADFDSRNYGFSKLHKLIDYTKAFETKYEQFENGGKNLVIRNKG